MRTDGWMSCGAVGAVRRSAGLRLLLRLRCGFVTSSLDDGGQHSTPAGGLWVGGELRWSSFLMLIGSDWICADQRLGGRQKGKERRNK